MPAWRPDRFRLRAWLAIGAFAAIGVGSFVVSAQQSPESILDCFERAEDETLLTEAEIQNLCFGAVSEGPSICYEAATDRTTLSNVEAISLCRCAESDGPVACYEGLREDADLWIEPAINACSEIATRRLYLDCTPIEPFL